MRLLRLRPVHRGIVLISALLMLGAVTATPAYAGQATTPWGSIRQVALASFNGRLYMAWIDPHAHNELTIASTTDGVIFSTGTHPFGSGNSNSAPALAVFNGKLWMAWTGTDSNSTLNLASSTNGTTFTQETKPLGNNNSPDGPALAVFNNKLYYGWKGTDSKHTLNLASSSTGLTFSAATQPGGGTYTSVNAPALAVWKGQLYLVWTSDNPNHNLDLASSADGVNFSGFSFQNTLAWLGNFEPSIAPDPFTGALDILWNGNGDIYSISYTGSATAPVATTLLALVEAPTITAFGGVMVNTWLGTDTGHTINMCFACFS